MAKNRKLNLAQYVEKVGAEVPEFVEALREEEAYAAFCKKVRGDLKQLREDLGIRQSDVAKEMQMSQPGVSKIEKGEGDIGLMTLCRYAGALGMQPTISFMPTASTYLEHDTLKATLRAMERLSDSRAARADKGKKDRIDAVAALTSAGSATLLGSQPAILAAIASAMSGAITQSLSNEIAQVVSAFSDVKVEELDEVKTLAQGDSRAIAG